jgi:hypothetical protein
MRWLLRSKRRAKEFSNRNRHAKAESVKNTGRIIESSNHLIARENVKHALIQPLAGVS